MLNIMQKPGGKRKMDKDIYKFWSRKKLKGEILKLKITYNQLFNAYKLEQKLFSDLILEKRVIDKKYKDLNAEYKRLVKDDAKLLNEHQKLYDCIQKWYEPIDNTKMAKLVEETKKLFESFTNIIY